MLVFVHYHYLYYYLFVVAIVVNACLSEEEVPVVMVVLEGGKNVLATVAKAARYGIPLVVIKNSGQAADALALAKEKFELAKEKVK